MSVALWRRMVGCKRGFRLDLLELSTLQQLKKTLFQLMACFSSFYRTDATEHEN